MNTKIRRLLALAAVLTLTMTFAVTVHAKGGPEYPTRDDGTSSAIPERDTETDTQHPVISEPLTPTGNLTLVDDVLQESNSETPDAEESDDPSADTPAQPENKQFITVQSKNGNYFYLVIDRSGETENVYFLNLVDESDLLALIETDGEEEAAPVCICEEKCVIGSINTDCEICAYNISDCVGEEPEPVEPEEPIKLEDPVEEPPDTKEEPQKSNPAVLLLVLIAVLGTGGFVLYKKFIQPKKQASQRPDPDGFEYDDTDEDDEEL